MQLGPPQERLQSALMEVVGLLRKHRVLETFTHRQETTRRDLLEHLQQKQNLVELQTRCRQLHPADLAYILESLPVEDRSLVWGQIAPNLKGAVLAEVSDAVRPWLLEHTDRDTLQQALREVHADDLAYLEGRVDDDVWREVSKGLATDARSRLETAGAFPDGSVGEVMRAEATDLIRQAPDVHLSAIMTTDPVVFAARDPIADAARAFERYDLISAPVVDERGKLLGLVTVDVVLDHIRATADRAALQSAGLGGEEDLFAPVFDSARNRWPWLFVNLLTAFFASRVIGAFESTIGQLVALATLMPIVASVGGNTGNQTVALVIRGLALGQLQPGAFGHLIRKELTVALLNGLLWGSVMGLFAVVIYHDAALGLIMMTAVFLNLIVAAVVGVMVPIALQRAGRDPAQGASVLLTFVTDSMGFFLFLGLARLLLL
jgi:magnesium transporter